MFFLFIVMYLQEMMNVLEIYHGNSFNDYM